MTDDDLRAVLGHIDQLTIDVERAELDVLAGIGPDDWPNIRQVAVEVHDRGGRCETIQAMLAEREYDVCVEQQDEMQGTGVRMLYASRR